MEEFALTALALAVFAGGAFKANMADTTINLDKEGRKTGKTVFVASDFTDITSQQIVDAKETFLDLETYWRRFRFEIDNLKENHRGEVCAFA